MACYSSRHHEWLYHQMDPYSARTYVLFQHSVLKIIHLCLSDGSAVRFHQVVTQNRTAEWPPVCNKATSLNLCGVHNPNFVWCMCYTVRTLLLFSRRITYLSGWSSGLMGDVSMGWKRGSFRRKVDRILHQ